MKILIVHEIEWIDKVSFEPHHLAELLVINGHEVFVVDCAAPNFKDLSKGIKTRKITNYSKIYKDAKITLIRPPSLLIKGFNRITHFFSCKKVIKKTIKDEKIEIVLLYGSVTNGTQTIQVAHENNIPVIYRLLDISHALIKIPLIRKLAKKNESKVISSSDKILGTTKDLNHYAIEMGAKKEKVEMFPLGVNFTDFKPMEKSQKIMNELNIIENDKIIVFVGTIYTFAGIELLIKEYHLFEKNVKIIIIGGGPDFDRIKTLVKSKKLEKNIILLGFLPQKEIAKYIALADICINPFEVNYITSRILPTKILEYLACQKPVLSTPLNGTIEVLPDKKYGVVYSNQESFVKNLSQILNDNENLEKLGNDGYLHVKNNYDWKHLSLKIFEIFEKTINEKLDR